MCVDLQRLNQTLYELIKLISVRDNELPGDLINKGILIGKYKSLWFGAPCETINAIYSPVEVLFMMIS